MSQLAVYYHTHWDREWYLPFRAYQLRLAEVVDAVLARLEEGVFSCFMLDGQTVVLEDYLALRPENRARLARFVRAGQLRIGPWWVMPDEFLVSGESLVRNLSRGLEEAKAWGCLQFTGYLPDTFGHSADMPTILRQSGLDSAVVWRGVNPAQSLFRWQSPGGEAVVALHLTDGYFQMMLHDWTATDAQKTEALQALIDKVQAASGALPALLPIGGDHLVPVTAEGVRLLKAIAPNVRETTPEQYLATLPSTGDLTLYAGELTDHSGSFLLPGVYSARMYLKQANRLLEQRLTRQLEPLLALTQGLVQAAPFHYPVQALKLAWEQLMLNHPHDSICGCSVDAVHRENEVRFDQVGQLIDGMQDRAVHHLAAQWATPDDWIVFNTGDRPYTGVVRMTEDVAGSALPTQLTQVLSETEILQDENRFDVHRIPLSHLRRHRRTGAIWVENVPACGLQVIPKQQASHAACVLPVNVSETRLVNGQIRLEAQPDGTLTITDLIAQKTYPGLLQFQDYPDQGDSYNSAPVPGTGPEIAELRSCRVVAAGPLIGVLELEHQLKASGTVLITRVRLEAGCSRVAFETQFTNTGPNHKLQVAFSTGQPIREVWAEGHFSLVKREYDPAYRELDAMPVGALRELKANTGPVQRFFSANGQSWITEGLCEYEVYQETLRITLLRAFGVLSSAETGVRGAQAGPPFETPEGQCLNRAVACRYAWLPTPSEPAALFRHADQCYGAQWGQSGCAEQMTDLAASSLVQWDNPALVAAACYWSPGKGLLLRLINTTPQVQSTTLLPAFACSAVQEVNFLEAVQATLGTAAVTVPAQGVKTFCLCNL